MARRLPDGKSPRCILVSVRAFSWALSKVSPSATVGGSLGQVTVKPPSALGLEMTHAGGRAAGKGYLRFIAAFYHR